MAQDQRSVHRRYFIGGSDARTIMGDDEALPGGKSAAGPRETFESPREPSCASRSSFASEWMQAPRST